MLNVLVIYFIFQILLKFYIGEGKGDTHIMKEKQKHFLSYTHFAFKKLYWMMTMIAIWNN